MSNARYGVPEIHEEPLPHQLNGRSYSLKAAIRSLADTGKLEGLEGEVSRELQLRTGKSVSRNAFLLPWDVQCRSLNMTTGAGGVATYRGAILDILRAKLSLAQFGATVLPDCRGGKL